jgi:hypothetical protein
MWLPSQLETFFTDGIRRLVNYTRCNGRRGNDDEK